MIRSLPLAVALALGLAFAPAPAVAAEARLPRLDAPAQWKTTETPAVGWTLAAPAPVPTDWRSLGDPVLADLVTRALTHSPTLAEAWARVDEARALRRQADAARRPQLELALGRERGADGRAAPGDGARAGLTFGLDLDLSGRLRHARAAADADSEAARHAAEATRLAVVGDVAATWFRLQGLREEQRLLDAAVDLRAQGLALVRARAEVGEASPLEPAQAETEWAQARAEREAVARARGLTENALAVLVGTPAPAFGAAPSEGVTVLPVVPLGLPSTLLQRRPDIAAAQAAWQAASGRRDAARAAFFPSLRLGASASAQGSGFGDLAALDARQWLLGALFSLPIFDGGQRRAERLASDARLEAATARYRGTVLQAFREVEDGLVALSTLDVQQQATADAVDAARRAQRLADTRYREGLVSYLEVLDAQRAAIGAERAAARLQAERAEATVRLMVALGGDWQDAAPAEVVTRG